MHSGTHIGPISIDWIGPMAELDNQLIDRCFFPISQNIVYRPASTAYIDDLVVNLRQWSRVDVGM